MVSVLVAGSFGLAIMAMTSCSGESELARIEKLAARKPKSFLHHLLLNVEPEYFYWAKTGRGLNALWGEIIFEADRIEVDGNRISIGANFIGYSLSSLDFERQGEHYRQILKDKDDEGSLVFKESLIVHKTTDEYVYINVADHFFNGRVAEQLLLKIPKNAEAKSEIFRDRMNNSAFRELKKASRQALLDYIASKT